LDQCGLLPADIKRIATTAADTQSGSLPGAAPYGFQGADFALNFLLKARSPENWGRELGTDGRLSDICDNVRLLVTIGDFQSKENLPSIPLQQWI
jgi:hypothetical protein